MKKARGKASGLWVDLQTAVANAEQLRVGSDHFLRRRAMAAS